MTKPLHAGRAAACGLEAVQFAKLGLTAAPDVFEHHAGYLAALSPRGNADRTSPCPQLGSTLRILDYGLSIKKYPTCYATHRVIDGVLDLKREHGVEASRVKAIRARIGVAQAPASSTNLHERVVGQVENELIRHVMQLCDHVQIKAAARLGINRNTLHKKIQEMKLGEDGVVPDLPDDDLAQ